MVKPNKCSVSIASAFATIDPKATMAVTISNIGFTISVVGDFTVDRQTAWMSIGPGVIYLHRATPRVASRAWDTLVVMWTGRLALAITRGVSTGTVAPQSG